MALGGFGLRPEFWESFTLLKIDRDRFEAELARLGELRRHGKPGAVSPDVLERFKAMRRDLYPLAKRLRAYMMGLGLPLDGLRLELALVFMMGSKRGREAAEAWVADPVSQRRDAELRLRVMGNLVDAYRQALLESRVAAPPEPAAPAEAPDAVPLKVHPKFLDDFRRAARLRELLQEAKAPVERWEALCLVLVQRKETAASIAELERLRAGGRPGEFEGEVFRVRGKLELVRQRYGRIAGELRTFLSGVLGRWEGEAEETAIAFIAASSKGRHRARQWLEDPELCREEAARFVEGLREQAREALGGLAG
jgi:hypothetical protein